MKEGSGGATIMCTKPALDAITIFVKDEALRIFADRLNRVILYGSYARGENEAASDIDIMLLLDMPAEKLSQYRSEVAKVASRLSLESEGCVTVSIVLQDVDTYDKYKSILPFYTNVDLEGVVVYAA
jgi:predicted nucleotidyltransferase